MAAIPNRAVTREYLARLTNQTEFGGALRRIREAAGLSIRRLERKAADRANGGPHRFVGLTKNLIEDMEKGKRLEGNPIGAANDNRLEIYLWCCGVPREDLPAWLETRRRIRRAALRPEHEPASDVATQLRPAVKTALRRDVGTFIGRDAELQQILAAAATDRGPRIYTIDGMPGIGKTALATRAAHLLVDQFPDGRYFVELHAHTADRAVAEPTDVLAGLLISLGVDTDYIPDSLEGRRDLWRDRLTGKRVLLILDDARDVAQIEPLLPAAPECLTLVTSRRRLITLDNTVPVALDILDPRAAAELFAALAQPTADGDADRAAVARIVRLCGYLPLAITLLAGRLAHHPTWTIAELADEFSRATDRLGELDAGDQVVRAAFDLSYRDLPSKHRLLFRRLGLHPGPDFDAHAAAALVGVDVATMRWDLDSLYTDHLLDEPARGRYRLHDLLREFARALADAEPGGDSSRAQERLLDYYQYTAAAADRWLTRWTRTTSERGDPPAGRRVAARTFGNEIQALEWMRLERENLLACLDTLADKHPTRVIALAGALAGLLDRDGPWPLAGKLHQRAVGAARGLGDQLGEACALNNLGGVHWRAGNYPAAIDRCEAALTLYRKLDDRLGEANVLNNLGTIHGETSDYSRAAGLHRQALTRYRRLGNRLGEANTLNSLGTIHEKIGEYPKAGDLHRQALALYHELGNRLGKANALNNLGIVRARTGLHSEAVDLHQQALALYHQLGNRLGEANALNNLGIVRTRTGLHSEAVDLHQQALALYHQLGNRLGKANALNNLGIVRARTGLHSEAVDLHQQALALYHQLGDRLGEANALNNLGIVRARTGLRAEAVDLHQRALALFRQLGYRRGVVEVLVDIGTLLLDTGAPDVALGRFTEALAVARELGSQLEQAHALEGIARCRVGMGAEGDLAELREAIEMYARIGAPEAAAAAAYRSTLRHGRSSA
ncbi:ATP-binding protein [Nocardia arthritidis]|uniref:Tetratricopeptide repeat protein n=1 Tax=Nocardia arthritidis TaxID=228602 RepID=A0A6G9YE74_9NOCA|nr:tetratricopeptide repeat protein [Nocardia arthritidis]QIS11464.1 tetratricopeptide repeat protein [Nocardia arthritidis]